MSIHIVNEIGLLGFLLVVGAFFSEGFKRMGQSTLLGELFVGILLGPSVLGWLHPTDTMNLFMELGLLLLLVETGLETQWRSIVQVGKQALLVAIVGILVPWIVGTGFALLNGLVTLTAVMVGATLTATSIGITARTLSDLNQLETPESQIILGAAVIDDILGLGILAFMQGISVAKTSPFAGMPKILFILLFMGLCVIGIVGWRFYKQNKLLLPTVVHQAFKRLGNRLINLADGTTKEQMLIIGCILVTCWMVQSTLGISMALVAFACGLFLKEREDDPNFKLVLRDVGAFSSIITPLFFVGIGMQLDVQSLNPFDPEQLRYFLSALGLSVLAIASKALSGFAIRDKGINSAFVGMGMVPRGEVGLIFVQVGKSSGLLDATWSNMLIIVVILTTLVAPFLLKLTATKEIPIEESV
ncbi:MAG: cation:proton antiporter [Vampirovibrionales bacterium]